MLHCMANCCHILSKIPVAHISVLQSDFHPCHCPWSASMTIMFYCFLIIHDDHCLQVNYVMHFLMYFLSWNTLWFALYSFSICTNNYICFIILIFQGSSIKFFTLGVAIRVCVYICIYFFVVFYKRVLIML